jgi:hypothetical protein
MSSLSKFVTRDEILTAFRSDVPRYLLPADVRNKYLQECRTFLETLSVESLKARRKALREKLNSIFSNVLTGKYEPPLSAYIRELPAEVLCFYIDRINEIEVELARAARIASDPVLRPGSWREYWLHLLTQRVW